MYLPTARARIGIFADNVGEIREALSSTHAVISVVRKAVRMFPTKHEVQHTISASVSLATRKRPRLAAVHTLLTIAPLTYFLCKTARRMLREMYLPTHRARIGIWAALGFPPQVSSLWYVRALGGFGLSTSGE